ncbi:MAG TPA: hypothetical protein P5511_09430, partial [Candidatus Goldiibacteriota bacterium]|nr:hypothetical protein [Candidatus Goldiibacteriota bacterium]
MYDKNLKNSSAMVKIIAFIFFAGAIAFTLMQKPKMSKELEEYFRETSFKTIGGTLAETGYSCLSINDGFVATGDSSSFGAGGKDVYLVKTDLEGNMLWSRTYGDTGNETGVGLCASNEGGFIIAGGTTSYGSGETDAYLIKTDAEGNIIWDFPYGGPNYDYIYSVCASIDKKGYLACGYSSSYNGRKDSDAYLLKVSEDGKKEWEKTYGGESWDIFYSINPVKGGYCLAGYTSSSGAGRTDIYVIKVDSKGDCVWAKTYGAERDDRFLRARIRAQGA